ncbi:sigma factor-like helix-turn-helix DNA-binding protein [Streptacidiphilus sp. EB103A]|uniref:sigma factor-like helix-turn-helix DNA-binding protein n=1 Tax=Streptacidiphilus sp. EB103A TaxID=3156275 RepID=UPI003517C585
MGSGLPVPRREFRRRQGPLVPLVAAWIASRCAVHPWWAAQRHIYAPDGLHGSVGAARDFAAVFLRFGAEMTQSEIGALLGISQLHVSRLPFRALGQLRNQPLTQD